MKCGSQTEMKLDAVPEAKPLGVRFKFSSNLPDQIGPSGPGIIKEAS